MPECGPHSHTLMRAPSFHCPPVDLSRRRHRYIRRRNNGKQRTIMRFSIIMPVLNEELVLDAQLAQLAHQCTKHDCELIIVDGGSSDRTTTIAQRYGLVLEAQRGRAAQMNAGAASANGDVLLFLHADTLLPGDA